MGLRWVDGAPLFEFIFYFCTINLHAKRPLIPAIKKLFTNKYFVLALFFGLSLIAVTKEILIHQLNNYYLYKYSFFHLVHQQNIYIPYPDLFFDHHHYGPFFGLIIAPFAVLPDTLGVFLWS
jgi:hypothetical protein